MTTTKHGNTPLQPQDLTWVESYFAERELEVLTQIAQLLVEAVWLRSRMLPPPDIFHTAGWSQRENVMCHARRAVAGMHTIGRERAIVAARDAVTQELREFLGPCGGDVSTLTRRAIEAYEQALQVAR